MKYFFNIVCITLLYSILVNAQLKSKNALKTELKKDRFLIHLQEGYHFNIQAPNSVLIDNQIYKPTKLFPLEGEFAGLPLSFKNGVASVYVCDDQVTFCESHKINFRKNGNSFLNFEGTGFTKGKINSFGFIENDYNKAIQISKQKSQLVLIDFSARWCPGCMRLENEIFNTSAFKDLTKNIIKVKLDTDVFSNQILSEKYNVYAIPSLILINSNEEEINRVVDYQPLETIKSFLDNTNLSPIKTLTTNYKNGNKEDGKTLINRLIVSERYNDVLELFDGNKDFASDTLKATVGRAHHDFKNNKILKKDFVKILKNAIEKESLSSRSLQWRLDLIEKLEDKSEIEKIADEGIEVANTLLKDSKLLMDSVKTDLIGEFKGFEKVLVTLYKADLTQIRQKSETDIANAWNESIQKAEELKMHLQKGGPKFRYLLILMSAKAHEKALKTVNELIKDNPLNGDLLRRKLRILVESNKYKDALVIGKKALKNSYERNEFWVIEQLIKTYIGLDKKKEAKALLDKYLAKPEIDYPNLKSTKEKFEKLRSQL